MTKGVGLFAFIAVVMLALPAYAQSSDEIPEGILSFSFEPSRFFQVGPTGEKTRVSPEPEEEGIETAGVQDKEEQVKDARMYVKLGLYGLFRFNSEEGKPDSFDMAGAYFRGDGEYKNFRLSLMADAAQASSLTWAYVDMAPWIDHKEKMKLRVGTFATPFGLQMPTFPYELNSIKYSLIVEHITDELGIYDMGAMLHGKFKVQDGGINYAFAFLNGEPGGTTDSNQSKNFCGRLGIQLLPSLEFGASYYRGKLPDASGEFEYNLERVGGDLVWKPEKFIIRGEFIRSSENPEDYYSTTLAAFQHDKTRCYDGWWLDAGMLAWVNEKLSGEYDKRGLEIYFHYQGFAPASNHDMRLATGHAHRTQFVYGVGFNAHLSKNVKLQALWQRYDLGRYTLRKYLKPSKRDNRVTVQLAVALF